MIIKQTPLYELRSEVREYAPDLFSVELFQLYPQALRPHWTRITQLNLSSSEVDALAAALIMK